MVLATVPTTVPTVLPSVVLSAPRPVAHSVAMGHSVAHTAVLNAVPTTVLLTRHDAVAVTSPKFEVARPTPAAPRIFVDVAGFFGSVAATHGEPSGAFPTTHVLSAAPRGFAGATVAGMFTGLGGRLLPRSRIRPPSSAPPIHLGFCPAGPVTVWPPVSRLLDEQRQKLLARQSVLEHAVKVMGGNQGNVKVRTLPRRAMDEA